MYIVLLRHIWEGCMQVNYKARCQRWHESHLWGAVLFALLATVCPCGLSTLYNPVILLSIHSQSPLGLLTWELGFNLPFSHMHPCCSLKLPSAIHLCECMGSWEFQWQGRREGMAGRKGEEVWDSKGAHLLRGSPPLPKVPALNWESLMMWHPQKVMGLTRPWPCVSDSSQIWCSSSNTCLHIHVHPHMYNIQVYTLNWRVHLDKVFLI